MLQHIGNELGINVDRTPKCHPEMAGEGIEYSWGCGKNHYRALPIADKKSKANFLANVRKCTSRDDAHISLKGVRLFSKRARSYMNAYYKLAHGLVEGKEFEDQDREAGEGMQDSSVRYGLRCKVFRGKLALQVIFVH